MSLQSASYLSLKYLHIVFLALMLAHAYIVEATFVYCSRENFGVPNYRDCTVALSVLPTTEIIQFFVEQQLRTGLPEANWAKFVDPRPFGSQREVVQVPKLWNHSRSRWNIVRRPITDKVPRGLQHCFAKLCP